MFNPFRPKHTFQKVVQELLSGLKDGTLTLEDDADDPEEISDAPGESAQPEPKSTSKYTMNFPDEIFDGGVSKDTHVKLTKCFPFATLLSDTVTQKYPDLAASIQGKGMKEQGDIIARIAGLDGAPNGGIEAVSLHLLIHLENRDTLKTIAEKFPAQYQRAVEEQGGEISPLKFTVRLLEEFGIQNRTFPDCYDALRTQVLDPNPGANPNPSPS